MRLPNSLFNRVCEFVNSVPEGNTYKSSDLIDFCAGYEQYTAWKTRYAGRPTFYRTRQYQSYLRRTGFIKHVKYGEWKVVRHVPAWFELGHLSILLGYYKTVKDCAIKTYKGMNRKDIESLLDNPQAPSDASKGNTISPEKNSSKVIGGTSTEPSTAAAKKLPALRNRNRKVYDEFIRLSLDTGKTEYSTQSELFIAIENIKNPSLNSVRNRPVYSGQGNYQPIIDHLIEDGVISHVGTIKGRYQYHVNLARAARIAGEPALAHMSKDEKKLDNLKNEQQCAIHDVSRCFICGTKIKHESSSLHVWDIEYECGCKICGAIDTKTHGDGIEVNVKCPNNIISKDPPMQVKVEKIKREESTFYGETEAVSKKDQTIDLSTNIGILETAKAVLMQFTSKDTMERARVYNIIAQVDYLSKELKEKTQLI